MFQIIITSRRAARAHPVRMNIEEPELPNAPKVQPQGEDSNVEFREVIRMLNQVVAIQVR